MAVAAAIRVGDMRDRLAPGEMIELRGDAGTLVSGIAHDSRAVRPGDLYVCIEGATVDGHEYAPAAVQSGATALMVARPLDLGVPELVVRSPRAAIGPVAGMIHGDPSTHLTVIGITGTNGKTTTAHLVGAILESAGQHVEVFGTLSGARTTPEAPELQARLAACVEAGSDTVVMEVSSHALALGRVSGTRFAVAAFTNLGRDHLDLHGSVDAYFRAKALLFTPEFAAIGVVNVDDPHGRLLADAAAIPIREYSLTDASEVEVRLDGHRFRWHDRIVDVPLGGATNISNSLAALTIADVLGVDADVSARGIAGLAPVPGRFEIVRANPDDPATVIVDYAHTPEGIDALLRSVREVAGGGRLILVFGCGGDRDREKRPLMGTAASAADVVVVTSDNPRSEAPTAIAADIVSGMTAATLARTRVELDRASAIGLAIAEARGGDIVILAGKGHETTQTIGVIEYPFDDREVAREALAARSSS